MLTIGELEYDTLMPDSHEQGRRMMEMCDVVLDEKVGEKGCSGVYKHVDSTVGPAAETRASLSRACVAASTPLRLSPCDLDS